VQQRHALQQILQDRVICLPPLNGTLARRIIERTRIYSALKGLRGQQPADVELLEAILARFSLLLADFVADIQEVEMNPVLASPGRIAALDARVLPMPAGAAPDARPHLAIHPYPNQYTAPFRIRTSCPEQKRAFPHSRREDRTELAKAKGRQLSDFTRWAAPARSSRGES